MSQADINEDEAGARIVDDYASDRQPDEQLLLRESFDAGEAAVGEIRSHHALVERHGVEFRQAGTVKEHFEKSIFRQRIVLHFLGEESGRQALRFEEIMDGNGGGGVERAK